MIAFGAPERRRGRRPLRLIAVFLLCAMAVGCGRDRRSPAPAPPAPAGKTAEKASRARPDTTGGVEAAAAHILIQYRGCEEAAAGVTRSREEAEDLARRVAVLAGQPGADFGALARRGSDDPAARRTSGYLGIIRRGRLDLSFETTLFGLKPGRVGGVVETPFGWHVVKRLPVRRVHAHHILIAWRGAERATQAVTRTKEQARALAEEVRLQALAAGADRCRLAQQFSDDPDNAPDCGDLGILVPGFLPPALDEALLRLRAGEVSPAVESGFGFHLIWIEP